MLSRLLVFIFILALPFLSQAQKLNLLSVQKYSSLNELQKSWYISELQNAWIEFENDYPKAGEFNDQAFWQNLLIPEAHATDAQKCVVGGAAQSTTVVNGRTACKTTTRPCGNTDGYLCGSIYGSHCVSRTPAETISTRCAEARKTPSRTITAAQIKSAGVLGSVMGTSPVPKTTVTETVVSTVSPAEYSNTRKETMDNYESLCAEKAPNTQEACNNFALQNDKVLNAPQLASSPQSQKIAPTKGTCAYGVDPATGYALQLPQFGFTEDFACLYKRNQESLTRVASTGCAAGGKQVGNELFLTRFRSKTNDTVFGGGNVFDVIIEEVTVLQKTSANDITYNIQALKPTATKPATLERKSMKVRHHNGQFFLCNPDCNSQVAVDVNNAVRSNIMPENLRANSETAKDAIIDAKVMMAKNCRLAGELKKQGLYQTGSSGSAPASSPTPANKARGTR